MRRGKFHFKRWRQDSFFSRNGTILKFDKLEHLILGAIGMFITLILWHNVTLQTFALLWLLWNSLGIFWEFVQFFTRDYLAEPKDVVANNLGFLLAGLVYFAAIHFQFFS